MSVSVACIIIGIDGWDKFTKPLVDSIRKHEPGCEIIVIDNESNPPYPPLGQGIQRTRRLCYSAAINMGKRAADAFAYESKGGDATDPNWTDKSQFDWYVVLSNDVLCTGPFVDVLAGYGDDVVVGPLLLETPIPRMGMIPYLEGWCMCFPKRVWDAIGGFDERFIMSSFEDVDASHEAHKAGFALIEETDLPFEHLDQKQRFYLPGYGGSEEQNMLHFMRKNGVLI